jgi:hypothetical protein
LEKFAHPIAEPHFKQVQPSALSQQKQKTPAFEVEGSFTATRLTKEMPPHAVGLSR